MRVVSNCGPDRSLSRASSHRWRSTPDVTAHPASRRWRSTARHHLARPERLPRGQGGAGAAHPDVGRFLVRDRVEDALPVGAASRSAKFQDAFWKTGRLDEIWRMSEAAAPSPVSEVFRAGYTELAKLQKRRQESADPASEAFLGDIESVERALDARARRPSPRWRARVPLLGTTASAAPVHRPLRHGVGHHELVPQHRREGRGQPGAVAPGIAEALVATAIGLMAAIPAVMAYNYFVAAHPGALVRDGDLLQRLPEHRAAEVLLAMSMSAGGGSGGTLDRDQRHAARRRHARAADHLHGHRADAADRCRREPARGQGPDHPRRRGQAHPDGHQGQAGFPGQAADPPGTTSRRR